MLNFFLSLCQFSRTIRSNDTKNYNIYDAIKNYHERNGEWLISDLIPEKSENIKFRKNFVTIFISVKRLPEKTKIFFYAHAIFEKWQN